MPPSQLKRLKSSLREQGITGPQKSKKQKKAAKGSKPASDRIQRNVALQQIRDSFNPFELKAPSRPAKFQHANDRVATNGSGGRCKDVLHRPGVSKSAGEEMRRATLLPEMQRRHKVGGLVDRRIGEGDPGMTAEERAVQRYAQEKQRKKGASLFDLEASDDDEPKIGLTHGGKNIGELGADDFGEQLSGAEESEDDGELIRKKRRRSDEEEEENGVAGDEVDEQPQRKKTKKEVMEEVIAKSKLHKYERQQAKEDDDDLREELDSGTSDLLALIRGHKPPPPPPKVPEAGVAANSDEPMMNPERIKLLSGMDRAQVNKEYDSRLRQLAQEQRAKPSERTKTAEEKIQEEAARLKELEEKRAKRMRGDEVSDDERDIPQQADENAAVDQEDVIPNEAVEFGFTSSAAQPKKDTQQLVLEDEDEFAFDEDLIASGSEIDMSEASESEQDYDLEDEEPQAEADEEDEFVKGMLGDMPNGAAEFEGQPAPPSTPGLAFTYPCPRSHPELLQVSKDSAVDQLPTIIQRIRALHHPSLSADNKEAMADFSAALVDHLSYMGMQKHSLAITEQVIRHLHSLSRTYPETIAKAFRSQINSAHERKDLHAGDLVTLTAIGSIYPTSDHFHQVVTPAITLMARWLEMSTPNSVEKHTSGGFLVALCLSYQKLSKRYIPEAIRFTLRALSSKPTPSEELKRVHLDNLTTMADLWQTKPAFPQIFQPFLPLLKTLNAKHTHQTLINHLKTAHLHRRPLTLHNHRPSAIRTSIPKFEEGFNPEKHYDPDKERSDARKLQREYKREKKGAVRELRKDAGFIGREQLREKKERDWEYERKYRRLVAEVQGEEGQETKNNEREKRKRKGGR